MARRGPGRNGLVAPPVETPKQAIKAAQVGTTLTRDVPIIGAGRLSSTWGIWPGVNFSSGINPDLIDFGTYDRMRGDSMIHAALTLIKAPILGQTRQAVASSPNQKVKAFLQSTVIDSGLMFRTMRTSLRAMEFGVALHEKIWQVKDLEVTYKTADPNTGQEIEQLAWQGPALTYKELKEVNPSTVKRIVRRGMDPYGLFTTLQPGQAPPYKPGAKKAADGSYDGFVQVGYLGLVSPATMAPEIYVPPEKTYVYTHELEFGNMWGRPRTRDAYPFYFWKQQILKFWMNWAEKKVVPPRIARFPIGKDTKSGKDNGQIAIETLNHLDNTTGVALPSSHIRDVAGVSRRTQSDWDITELPVTDKSDTFDKIFTTLNTEILRAMFVPERTFTQGDVGAYAMAQAHTDTFLITLDAVLADIMEAINRWIIMPLVLVNFGPDDAVTARVQVPGITDEEREFLRTVFTDLLTNPSLQYRIDFDAIGDRFGVPLKDPELRDMPQPGLPGQPGVPGQPGEEEDDNEPGTQGGESATATPGQAPNDAGVPPSNFVLSEDEEGLYVSLAGFDANRWDVIPDDSSRLGYRVMDKSTGLRLNGWAAYQVIKSFQGQSNKAGKAAAAEAKAAARKQVSAERSELSREAHAARHAAKQPKPGHTVKGAPTAPQAKGGAATAHSVARAAQQHSMKAATVRPLKEPSAFKLPHAKGDFVKPPKPVQPAKPAKPKKAPKAAAKTAIGNTTIKAVRQQRATLQAKTVKQPKAAAAQTVAASGWKMSDVLKAQKQGAIDQAMQLASQDLDNIYTVVKTADGWTVMSKPREYIHVGAVRRVRQQGEVSITSKRYASYQLTDDDIESGDYEEVVRSEPLEEDEDVNTRGNDTRDSGYREYRTIDTSSMEAALEDEDEDLFAELDFEHMTEEERDELLWAMFAQAQADARSWQEQLQNEDEPELVYA